MPAVSSWTKRPLSDPEAGRLLRLLFEDHPRSSAGDPPDPRATPAANQHPAREVTRPQEAEPGASQVGRRDARPRPGSVSGGAA